ncbi:MAG: hypothetical protein WDW38_001934 [Sanguina aurantia]
MEAQALATLFVADPEPAEKWDVESVLSMRSNVEHHPARIVEPQKRAGSKGARPRNIDFTDLMMIALQTSSLSQEQPAYTSEPRRSPSPFSDRASPAQANRVPFAGLIKLSSKSGLPTTVSAPNAALNVMLGGGRPNAGLEAISENVENTPSSPTHQQQQQQQSQSREQEEEPEVEEAHEVEEFNDDLTDDMLHLLLSRQKNETAEDKKVRKATVKAMQRASRVAKKETKELFKSEELKQIRQQAGKGSNVTTFVIP